MPISSSAGKWTRTACNNKTNLRRSPNWSDKGQSSSQSPGSSNLERRAKLATSTKRPSRAGSSASTLTSNDLQESQINKQIATISVGVRTARRSLSIDKQQQQIRIEKPRGETEIQIQSERAPGAKRLRKIMNSLGGQRVITGTSASAIDKSQKTTMNTTASTMAGEQSSSRQMNLISRLVLGGGGSVDTTLTANVDDYKKPPRVFAAGGGKTYSLSGHKSALNYHLAGQQQQQQQQQGKTSLHGSQASLLNNNPSMSFQASSNALAAGSSASSATSSLANLHNQHAHSSSSSRNAPLNISKRVNLKYVKSLIVLLMSLDLLITVFVYHFSSHDELPIAFTSHKLRFSLLNLALSSIWFVVLSAAIIFDIYPILLLGCLVDFASFLLLLVCSFIHFTHRIDYNTVNLTSLLLLLFSIIVLHVYLLVIAALTTYLMLAVRRRRKMHS